MRRLKVLAFGTYPDDAAVTRYRVHLYQPLLRDEGIDVDFRPFLTNGDFAALYDRRRAPRAALGITKGLLRRSVDLLRIPSADVVLVQREAMLVGPPVVEWIAAKALRKPLVLDLDDATYIARDSEVYGRLATLLKYPRKTLALIRWASHVVAGNPTIASFARAAGRTASVLPTIVDLDEFTPARKGEGPLVIGWIGSHSTFPYLERIFPVLQRLAQKHRFVLRIIGSGRTDGTIEGVTAEWRPWRRDSEVAELQSFDIGVYPITRDEWAEGKSGFKAIQYLSVGIPWVATPVGVVAEIGVPGATHLEAESDEEWYAALDALISDPARRRAFGAAGREYALQHYSLRDATSQLASILRAAARV